MDDVDAAEALQAKNMLLTGDWVTQRLNGTSYFDKAPLKYWVTACLYKVLGIHDWVARIPTAIAAILLCWLVYEFGRWSQSEQVAYYSGLVMATSVGLFLFTRTIIPDVILTLFIATSLWCLIRALASLQYSLRWALAMYASLACAVLTKGLIGLVFPVVIAGVYLVATRRTEFRKLHVLPGIAVFLLIAAPWHILAIIRNPPVFDLTLHAGNHFDGQFRGFFWFYFINEQLLRFLNQRWPRDYNTVPRLWFWLYHLLWFFPWTFCLPAIVKVKSKIKTLLYCWIGVVMLFFTLSTTQEYYSMPIYPAIALLLGSAMTVSTRWVKPAAIFCLALGTVPLAILIRVWSLPTPGDIYNSLIQHPVFYTLSLGHMADLTFPAFAYLRLPLAIAAAAFISGSIVALVLKKKRAYVVMAVMMVAFFQAARLALIVFDPYLSSHAVADKLNQLPRGTVIVCGKYNPLSSVFFYSQDKALQNDADVDILEYGSLAPNAPQISISDDEMKRLWNSSQRVYIIAKAPKLSHLESVLGQLKLHIALQSADKYLLTNQ